MEVLTDSNIKEYVSKYFVDPSSYPSITNWDVSRVTKMAHLLSSSEFNEPLNWDVSNVTDMTGMFLGCSSFNSSLTWDGKEWIVSKVTRMPYMFYGCKKFNQDIGNWDVSNVTSMSYMFMKCTEFNNNGAPLNWIVSKVTDMLNMFDNCWEFNQDIGNWDVSKVTNMNTMFRNCYKFIKNIGNWKVSKVTDMRQMFEDCREFNQDIGNWDVSKVTNMARMFEDCNRFNKNIGNWDVSKVTDMFKMFKNCTEFNNNGAPLNWIISKVKNMSFMFEDCHSFDIDIGNWDVSNVTDMVHTFENCYSFDQDLSGWNTSSVTTHESMFESALIRPEYKPIFKSEEEKRHEHEQRYKNETEIDRRMFGHEWNDTTKEYRLIFSDYLKEKKIKYLTEVQDQDKDKDFLMLDNEMLWELGLNCRYGVELEFTHASLTGRTTRFVLGNRINNCIIAHNPKEFYSHRFDLKSRESILTQQKQLSPITSDKNFDEWSNFLIEVMSDYHAPTHDRVPTDNDNGRNLSGFKIEKDPGVLFNGLRFRGDSQLPGDEYSSDGFIEETGIYEKEYTLKRGREDSKVTIWKNGPHQIDSKIITMTSGDASIDIVNVKDVMDLFVNISAQTELVTPILVDEPFKIGDTYYPYGVIALENMIQHMKNHSNALFVQNDGLHIHISKNLNDGPFTNEEITGFIKLFWVFEPLFLAGEPTYRSENNIGGYRSLQSIFSYHEILNTTSQFDVLGSISRYVSLNISNLVPSGIGTFEYRIGHGTFDGKSLQLHTHLLQVLFQFNLALIKLDPDFKYHNQLLRTIHAWNGIPKYTHNYTTDYKEDYENYHFFGDSTTIDDRSRIILTLAKCFATSTGAVKGITTLIDYIQLYHTRCETTPSVPSGFPEYYTPNLEPIKEKWDDWLGSIDSIETIKFHHFEIPSYIGIDDPREACSDENRLYNDGLPLAKMQTRGPGDVMNVKSQFRDQDFGKHGKIQTELLNSKLKGGKRTKVKRKRTRRQKHGKRTRHVQKRTFRQTAGLNPNLYGQTFDTLKDPNELKLYNGVTNHVKPTLEYTLKDSDVNHNGVNMNRYLDAYDLNVDLNKMLDYTIIISSPCKFTDISNINVRLSHVASSIIDKKIINMDQLKILVKLKYMDSFLYLKEHNCLDELLEIGSLNMTPEIFNQIKEEYKRVYSTTYDDNHIFLDLNKYLKR